LLKLVLTPVLIAAATLAGRRWGHTMSGWLVGLPFTSGPVILFLALEQGTHFAALAALGVVLGVTSQAAFALAYVYLGGKASWIPGSIWGTAGFALATAVFELVRLPGPLEPPLVLVSLLAAIALMPARGLPLAHADLDESADLWLRILIATALVVGLTSLAPVLGPRLSGLLSPFPVYAAILAIFAHRQGGYQAACLVWRGLLFGLFAFLGFFSLLAATLMPLGIALSFALAVLFGLTIQGVTLLVQLRQSA
jgi:hypothetical protein